MTSAVLDRASATEVQKLEELNRAYLRSIEHSDVRWFEEHLADDFLNTSNEGVLADRAAFLALIARPCPLSNFRPEDVLVRILGDVAIIHARSAYTKADGRPGAGRYTDIYARRGGRWLCVAAQVMRG